MWASYPSYSSWCTKLFNPLSTNYTGAQNEAAVWYHVNLNVCGNTWTIVSHLIVYSDQNVPHTVYLAKAHDLCEVHVQ